MAEKSKKYNEIYAAYNYAYAAVLQELTRRLSLATGTEKNKYFHSKVLANPTFKAVVCPNIDNIYSQIFVDLTAGPLVLEKPETDRYLSIALLDAYTNCEILLGTGGDGNEAKTYFLTGPEYTGEIPKEYTHIEAPGNFLWGIVRTIIYNEADLENVFALQEKLTVRAFEPNKKPLGEEYKLSPFKPSIKIQELSLKEFFDIFNFVHTYNKDKYEPAELENVWAAYGIGAGKSFTDEIDEEIKSIPADFHKALYANLSFGKSINGWGYPADHLGIYKTDYALRSATAFFGLGANPVSMCIYPATTVDADGNQINGENDYVLHLDSLPPLKKDGFWSVTLYDNKERYLVENEIDRYGITDRTKLRQNADGSYDLYIQNTKPEGDKADNWLPAPREDFLLVFRIYLPGEAVTNGSWVIPAVKKV
ncbi:MAG: DUF1254 domain-containing protein [Lachnospiraceae bacterium]|nr:DUF1254 domain-containing protein [Lachnospiraceae bacterium]